MVNDFAGTNGQMSRTEKMMDVPLIEEKICNETKMYFWDQLWSEKYVTLDFLPLSCLKMLLL